MTVDLDVLVRDDLLKFLKKDSETRGATILCEHPSYARSIFALVLTLDTAFLKMRPISSMG